MEKKSSSTQAKPTSSCPKHYAVGMRREKGQWRSVLYVIQGNKVIEAHEGDDQTRLGAISEVKTMCVRKLFNEE